MSNLVARAAAMARTAHAGQVDKSGRDYISHPARVADRVARAGGSDAAVAAAWLHDVLEYTSVTSDDLRVHGFSATVTEAAEALTQDDNEPRTRYLSRVAKNPLAVAVKRADISDSLDPVRLSRLPEAMQKRLRKKLKESIILLDELTPMMISGRTDGQGTGGRHRAMTTLARARVSHIRLAAKVKRGQGEHHLPG